MCSRQQLAQINGPGEGEGHLHVRRGGDAVGPQVIAIAVEEGGEVGEVRGDGHGRGGVCRGGRSGSQPARWTPPQGRWSMGNSCHRVPRILTHHRS